ncbi:MAG: M15 family metallopeptidase, partial [Patescibacteria group bacterium]
ALIAAIINLNKKGFIVKIESMYRSIVQQKEKFSKRVQIVKAQYPNKNMPEIKKIANIYTAGIPILAAHMAGAAIDVVLMNKDQKIVNMGSDYPQGVNESYTEYPYLPEKVKSLRKTLCEVMASEGLINYPFEWWHFSMGDVCASYLKGQKMAIYGPLEYDIKTGKTEYLATNKCYEFF